MRSGNLQQGNIFPLPISLREVGRSQLGQTASFLWQPNSRVESGFGFLLTWCWICLDSLWGEEKTNERKTIVREMEREYEDVNSLFEIQEINFSVTFIGFGLAYGVIVLGFGLAYSVIVLGFGLAYGVIVLGRYGNNFRRQGTDRGRPPDKRRAAPAP